MATKVLCLLEDSQLFIQSYMGYLKQQSKGTLEYMTLPIAPEMLATKPLTTLVSVLKKKFGDPEQDIDYIFSFNSHYRYIKPGTMPDIPIVEFGNSISGPDYRSRPFMNQKKPCAWEDKVLKVEPAWFNQIIPLANMKMIYQMQDSYRYAYLRQVVDEYKANRGGNIQKDPEYVVYLPDWTTHIDSILNNVYRCLDFCSQQDCHFHLALTKHLLNETDDFFTAQFGIKKDSLNSSIKILKTELSRFQESDPNLRCTLGALEDFHTTFVGMNPKVVFIDPSHSAWLEALYMMKYKGLDCHKVRLVFSIEKKFAQIESKMFDKNLPDIEKFFKDGLFRKDVHSVLGNISTTTDKFYSFINYHDRPLEVLDLSEIASKFPAKNK
ncbi:hypothetical protein CCZ01_01160 [Helicobacter monodelphidis]|uniref:hypothetical protein n=1 Tax=Helicobacter sp. 15-1451 TaxID=2004995 RepID=UPI000DCB530B|nr:hypothetical protein [Helicobacter sp. 15-1451]RAX58833.1 hypothetical protein CCZ01_01160 [Helicobacter sp. 15-1451]